WGSEAKAGTQASAGDRSNVTRWSSASQLSCCSCCCGHLCPRPAGASSPASDHWNKTIAFLKPCILLLSTVTQNPGSTQVHGSPVLAEHCCLVQRPPSNNPSSPLHAAQPLLSATPHLPLMPQKGLL
uniref:Uncharacterized protein n=1 Tax=Buteo japonicus TaxID=224669 RepID=A0A8C0HNH5_9AVES